MRIHLHLSPNTEVVPYNYQPTLVGAFHKWLGENNLHDDVSLYSLSWLSHGKSNKKGLNFPSGSSFYVSAPDQALLTKLIQGVFKGHSIRWGMEVEEVTIQRTPAFGNKQRFIAQSPILIKRKIPEAKQQEYYFPGDNRANELLTETLQTKLKNAGLEYNATMRFDPEYRNPRSKMVRYRNINIKATLCPVIVEGDERAVQFAWEVGAGSSTGIGFGALI